MSTILIISPEPWDGHFVSKHHYACELARRGHSVLFYGPPDDTGPLRLVSVTDAAGDLRVLHAPRVVPGLRFLPGPLRRAAEARWLEQVESIAGQSVDVVWLFENSRFFDMSFAGERLKLYHQVDLNQDYHPQIAAQTADHVFCTSRPIYDRLKAVRLDASIINHGVLAKQIDSKSEAALFPEDKINCVYVGNLSMKYLDRDLVIRCVEDLPKVLFHFFGGFTKGDPFRERLIQNDNVLLHGKVASSRILPILSNADALMTIYEKAHFVDQSNPHKMMEYMMSGKVTVATYTMEYESVSDLLAMCSREGDYLETLRDVIHNIDRWNTPEQMNRRKMFAADNAYPRQLDRIAQALGPRGLLIS